MPYEYVPLTIQRDKSYHSKSTKNDDIHMRLSTIMTIKKRREVEEDERKHRTKQRHDFTKTHQTAYVNENHLNNDYTACL